VPETSSRLPFQTELRARSLRRRAVPRSQTHSPASGRFVREFGLHNCRHGRSQFARSCARWAEEADLRGEQALRFDEFTSTELGGRHQAQPVPQYVGVAAQKVACADAELHERRVEDEADERRCYATHSREPGGIEFLDGSVMRALSCDVFMPFAPLRQSSGTRKGPRKTNAAHDQAATFSRRFSLRAILPTTSSLAAQGTLRLPAGCRAGETGHS
jgi:hypothetical protein